MIIKKKSQLLTTNLLQSSIERINPNSPHQTVDEITVVVIKFLWCSDIFGK